MIRIIIYSASLLCPLLCAAMERTPQSVQKVTDKVDEAKQKYDEATSNLIKDPNQALTLLREAESLGHIGARKKLDEIRKSDAFRNPSTKKKFQPI